MTHTTIEGVVLDLSGISDEQGEFYDRVAAAWQAGVSWANMMSMIRGTENPLLRQTGGVITQDVYDHPLYRALNDLENRAGIQQGYLRWEKPLPDPFTDEWIPVSAAAEEKGVSVQAIHGAIERGDLAAQGTTRKTISRRSLNAWTPNRTRQQSGRMARTSDNT